MQKVIIVHIGNVIAFPPILSLIENLLHNGRQVQLISTNTQSLPAVIRENPNFRAIEIASPEGKDPVVRLKRRYQVNEAYRRAVTGCDDGTAILWTTTDLTVRGLGNVIDHFAGRHVMQLMELEETMPLYKGAKHLTYPIQEYARKAKRVVVPEMNRAYIQKVWWNLPEVPAVLPNKPYSLDPGEKTDEIRRAMDTMEKEPRKIILFLGNISADRDLRPFAEAAKRSEGEYCLYLIGGVRDAAKRQYDQLMNNYGDCVRHLGYFKAPSHLHFLKYASIGLLPYETNTEQSYSYSPLNVLYCAPNKIFEYAGFGVPMIGTDILGLRQPFEKYQIGLCCKELSADAILAAMQKIGAQHKAMSENCKAFFDSVDLDAIVADILR